MTDKLKFSNDLIHESSPYLLQHAHNPVNWVSWSDQAFEEAQLKNKLVLVSVGYSSCHWCHVMERESFEDESVAEIMNAHFVCIKVDREERPDVDQVYMSAVQLMTGQGGWPLNCITLPNGKPIYGGTYFRKEQWSQILLKLADLYTNEPERMEKYADEVESGIKATDIVTTNETQFKFEQEKLDEIIVNWRRRFDHENGGPNKAPKFPLPNNYEFLLRYTFHRNDEVVASHVEQTLDKMANGGIFDQIGGGFARYSVDGIWKVPHFEKMLYDNAQLIGLYSDAYKIFKKDHYREVVEKTIQWLKREMLDDSGAFYSALDADSEGVEGKFYVWKEEELREVLDDDFELVQEFYNVNRFGYWEDGNYILMRSSNIAEIANQFGLKEDDLHSKVQRIDNHLLDIRAKRIAPGLDDKCLTAWNALLVSGLLKAYHAFGDAEYLILAKKIGNWIQEYQIQNNDDLLHTFKNGKSTIDGFLDDYATVIQAFLDLYESTFDSSYFFQAERLLSKAETEFKDDSDHLYFFTDKNSKLIVRQKDKEDNVIPSTNSIMALNVFRIGKMKDDSNLIDQSEKMLHSVYDGMEQYGSAFSNWSLLLLNFVFPFNEFVISGENSIEKLKQLHAKYIPNALFVGGESNSIDSPIGQGKFGEEKIYVCQNKTCQLPVETVESALKEIRF